MTFLMPYIYLIVKFRAFRFCRFGLAPVVNTLLKPFQFLQFWANLTYKNTKFSGLGQFP